MFKTDDNILKDLSANSQKWQKQLKKGGSIEVNMPSKNLVECSKLVDKFIVELKKSKKTEDKNINLTWLRTTLDEEVLERAKADPKDSDLQGALQSIMPRIVDKLLVPGQDKARQDELKALLADWEKADKGYLAKLVDQLDRDEQKWQRLLTMGEPRKWAETCANLQEDRALKLLAAMQESKSKDCKDFGTLLLRQLSGYHQGGPAEVKQTVKWAAQHPEMFRQVMGMVKTAGDLPYDDVREIVPSLLSIVEHQGCSAKEMQDLLKLEPFLLLKHSQLGIYAGIPADDGYKLRGIYAKLLLGMIAPSDKNFSIDEVQRIVDDKKDGTEKLVRLSIIADALGIDTVCPWRTNSDPDSMQKMMRLLWDLTQLQFDLEQRKSDKAPVLLALNAVLHAPLNKNVGTLKEKDTAREIRTHISGNIYVPLFDSSTNPPIALGRLWAAAKDDMAKYGVLPPAAEPANAKQSRN